MVYQTGPSIFTKRTLLCSLGFPWVEVVWDTILRRFGFHPTSPDAWIEGQKMRPEVWPCEVSFSLRCWISQYITTYCGWKKSCTTLDGWNPINTGITTYKKNWCRISSIHSITIFSHLMSPVIFSMDPHSTYITTQCIWPWSHASTTRQLNAKALVGQSLRGFDRSSGGGCSGGSPTTDQFFYGWEFLSNLYGYSSYSFMAFTKIIIDYCYLYVVFLIFVIWFIDTGNIGCMWWSGKIPVEVWNMILVCSMMFDTARRHFQIQIQGGVP